MIRNIISAILPKAHKNPNGLQSLVKVNIDKAMGNMVRIMSTIIVKIINFSLSILYIIFNNFFIKNVNKIIKIYIVSSVWPMDM